MKDETADLLNRRARMTPAERDRDICREAFGPFFERMFGAEVAAIKQPDEGLPWDESEDDDEQE